MKPIFYLVTILLFDLIVWVPSATAQPSLSPDYFSVGYFGETITHPGVKVGTGYHLSTWTHDKQKDGAVVGENINHINGSINLGFYYHHRFQTGLFLRPELDYVHISHGGTIWGGGISTGYYRSFLPATFEVNGQGNVEQINAGHNYFMAGIHGTYGKVLGSDPNSAPHIFLKPAVNFLLPNFPFSINFFSLEIGISIPLNSKTESSSSSAQN